jgi:hypothetical protein
MIKYHLINTYNNLFKILSDPQGVQLDFDGEIKEQTNKLTEEIAQGGYSELHIVDKRAAENILTFDYSGMPIDNENLVIGHVFKLLRDAELRTKMSKGAFTWHHDYLRASYTSNYKRYLDVLFELGILEKTVSAHTGKCYLNGVHSSYYRLTDGYREGQSLTLVYREIDRRNVCTSYEKQVPDKFKKAVNLSYIDYPTYVAQEIRRFVINDPADSDRARSLASIKLRFNSAFSLLEKRYIKEGVKSTRIYHSFSNLSRIARQYLRTPNGYQYYEIDIVNSQPIFLVAYLNGQYAIDQSYIDITENGKIYEQFIGVTGRVQRFYKDQNGKKKDKWEDLHIHNRQEAKVEFFSAVLFHWKKKHPLNIKFKELFPLTWAVLNELHKEEGTLASKLQSFESEFIHGVAIEKSNYYFTLHDAIYYDNITEKKMIEKQIIEAFKKYGVKVKLK